MADPLRRTLLAKLRGKKSSKKGSTSTTTATAAAAAAAGGGGYGAASSAATAADGGGREAFIENVHGPHTNHSHQDAAAGSGRANNEPSFWRPPLNTSITVSKKRNWLQQSSLGKSHHHHHHHHHHHGAKDEPQGGTLGAEEEPPPPSPSPDHLRVPPAGGPQPPPRPLRLHLPQVSVGQSTRVAPSQPRRLDPSEENDADDEGEIWYNPIPEEYDEPPAAPHRPHAAVRLLVPPPRQEQQQAPQRRPSRGGGDASQRLATGRASESTGVPEELGGGSGGGEGSQGNAAHSCEAAAPLHRQMLACKPHDEASGRATDGPVELPPPSLPGFSSPPSSPNPAKKSSSINWSFPDKIKSPRTVRKLSMKMKKLPELSRKLSVKGMPSGISISSSNSSSNNGSAQSETQRAHSPKTSGNSSQESAQQRLHIGPRLPASGGAAASRNVISRYHLDSSVSTTQHSYSKKKSGSGSKSASKGGYLSDGDSPELVAKAGNKHGGSSTAEGKAGGGERTAGGGAPGGVGVGGGASPKLHGTELDIDAFRHYSFSEQPRCAQYISGLMSLHFYGAEDLKPPRVDSRDVYCAIQVDSVNKARTALLTCRTSFLDMDHTFNIELENAQHLKLVVFSWEPTAPPHNPRPRNRVCCHGTVALPALFRVTRGSHQLAVKLEPRGLIYVKLNLMEQWQNSLGDGGGPDGDREPQVFGVEAWRVVEREATGLMVPLLIENCITEIEKRGCQVVGLYRLCGSAAVKKELREAFERDSYSVELSENTYPDINVITGVLKDYLRELPYPLIDKQLYEAVLDSMSRRPLRMGPGGCENDQADTETTVSLLDILPEVEKATLRKLLDHLKLVAWYQESNKMTCQNLAVCFGPVLLSQRQEASCHTNRVFIDSEELASALHFKKHIEVLHYLLQLWPVPDPYSQRSSPTPTTALAAAATTDPPTAPPLRRRKERPQVLNLSEAEMAGVLVRPRPGRLDSPSNRYAGDWSCAAGECYFPPGGEVATALTLPPPPLPGKEEADYDDVASEGAEPCVEEEEEEGTGCQEQESERAEGQGEEAPASREEENADDKREEDVKGRGEESEPNVQTPFDSPEERGEERDGGEEEVERGPEEEQEGKEEREETEERPGEELVEVSEEDLDEDRPCDRHILLSKERHATYQAYMKIQDISPVLSNRVNLRDLQESIDTLIGNLERELNKNKLNVGY